MPETMSDDHVSAPKSEIVTTEQNDAAETIQRNYRGYKSRREMNGLGLDASTRWDEALKEARYRNLIRPRPSRHVSAQSVTSEATTTASTTFARSEWQRLRQITRHAHEDDTSETDGEEGMSQEQLDAYRAKKADEKHQREQHARQMGLEYWLEMVDVKHRYGSHLRSFHAVWKTADTHDNFFHWLDEGDGRFIDTEKCSRQVLDRDQVRYLSREERQMYLVKIDDRGRLRYAKNNEPVNTTPGFKDSLNGIVPIDDTAPAFREKERFGNAISNDPEESSGSGEDSSDDGAHYNDDSFHQAKGLHKIQHVSANAVLNHLLKSTTKKNTWIFVADTSFRLYVGIKQSGAFQHSSFLHGSRIASAGQLKVKEGQLRMLAPLSGHYQPPTAAFRSFVASLRDRGVDMSRLSIGRSYAVLLGVEGYQKSKKKTKDGVASLSRKLEKVFAPEKAREKEERTLDKSESARRERELLEQQKMEKRSSGIRSLGRGISRSGSQPQQGQVPH